MNNSQMFFGKVNTRESIKAVNTNNASVMMMFIGMLFLSGKEVLCTWMLLKQ
ncbi:hypothetical protein [Colwellia ponticola]|uniref:hypothetical protein n=1 Tax=Colwellia ponticola TaxID=2304625 RepID=UPI001FE6EE36|nr:hypothetical protein [Colwellia ponticola]